MWIPPVLPPTEPIPAPATQPWTVVSVSTSQWSDVGGPADPIKLRIPPGLLIQGPAVVRWWHSIWALRDLGFQQTGAVIPSPRGHVEVTFVRGVDQANGIPGVTITVHIDADPASGKVGFFPASKTFMEFLTAMGSLATVLITLTTIRKRVPEALSSALDPIAKSLQKLATQLPPPLPTVAQGSQSEGLTSKALDLGAGGGDPITLLLTLLAPIYGEEMLTRILTEDHLPDLQRQDTGTPYLARLLAPSEEELAKARVSPVWRGALELLMQSEVEAWAPTEGSSSEVSALELLMQSEVEAWAPTEGSSSGHEQSPRLKSRIKYKSSFPSKAQPVTVSDPVRGKGSDEYNRLLEAALGAFYKQAARLQAKKEEIAPFQIQRNSPCPCGSGRKYKACHGVEL
jgi:hypothetical protein